MSAKAKLEEAVEHAGSQVKLGKAIGVSQHAIWAALDRGRVSARMARLIDDWSDGKFSRRDLCPEVFGDRREPLRMAS